MQGLNVNNFTTVSRTIQNNRIEANLVEDAMKRQIHKNRNKYAYPSTIDYARIHRHSSRFLKRQQLNTKVPQVCPCCDSRTDGQNISICTSTSPNTEQSHQEFSLPSGIALYFSLIKVIIIFALILTAFSGYYIYSTSQCQLEDIYPTFKLELCQKLVKLKATANNATGSTTNSSDKLEHILSLVAISVAILLFTIHRRQKNKWHKQISAANLTENTYTIMISNIPVLDFPAPGESSGKQSQFFYRKHLQQFLQSKVRGWVQNHNEWKNETDSNEGDYIQMLQKNYGQLRSKSIVKSITLCYNLSRLQIVDDTLDTLIKSAESQQQQSTSLIDNIRQSFVNSRFSSLPKRVEFINDCRVVLNKQFACDNSFLFNLTHFVGHSFVSFQYQHYRNFFLDAYENNKKSFIYNGNVLKIAPAPHPADVIWQNMRFQNYEKQGLHLNSVFLILLVLAGQILLLAGLNLVFYQPAGIYKLEAKIFIILATFVILATQSALRKMIKHLVIYQRHKSKINLGTAFIQKTVIAQFLAVAVPLYLLNAFMGSGDLLHFYGNNFIFISSILQILYGLIHPNWLFKQIRRWYRYRNCGQNQPIYKFQFQLNKQFEYPEYLLPRRYAYYIYKLYVAAFFAYPAPVGMLVTFITLILMYWVDKINLFYRASLYYQGDIKLSNHTFRMAQSALLIYALVYYYLSSQVQHNSLGLIGLCLAGAYFLLVWLRPTKLQRLLFGRQGGSEKYIYDDCVADGKFSETYWSRNPATYLVQQSSVTKKEVTTNPALLRNFAQPKKQ